MMLPLYGMPVFLTFVVLVSIKEVAAISCYVCESHNNSNPLCGDMNPVWNATNGTDNKIHGFQTDRHNYIVHDCLGQKKGRSGLYPADHCIKVKGTAVGSNNEHTVIIRTCALDSGSLTADQEIVRVSHCGHFYLDETYYKGCVQSCSTDGCNSSSLLISSVLLVAITFIFHILRS